MSSAGCEVYKSYWRFKLSSTSLDSHTGTSERKSSQEIPSHCQVSTSSPFRMQNIYVWVHHCTSYHKIAYVLVYFLSIVYFMGINPETTDVTGVTCFKINC